VPSSKADSSLALGLKKYGFSKSYSSHTLRHRLHVWTAECSHLISQVVYQILVTFTEKGAQGSHEFFHCLLLDRCRHLTGYRGVHRAMVASGTSGATVLARPVVRSLWSHWWFWGRRNRPSAVNALRVTVAHVVPQVIFSSEDLTFVKLQADKTNMVQGIIPMCHTMSKKGIPPSICLFTSCLNTSPCFV
jgi:hypothetical protein